MNKLAFWGVIILGLALLVTHLVVTAVIGIGPYFVISSHKAMESLENFEREFTTEIEKITEDVLSQHQKDTTTDTVERILLDGTRKYIPLQLSGPNEVFEQNSVEALVKRLNKQSKDLKPIRIEMDSFTFTLDGPTYKLNIWIILYGLIGSVLIMLGTSFLAIALFKRLKTTKQPDD